MEISPLPQDHSALQGYKKPEMMAIGDSIFNGIRSLSIDSQLAAFSPPALVATGLNIPFQIPNYPYPVLFDMEQEVRDGVDLSRLHKHVVANVDKWLGHGGAWSDLRFFDNISVGGAEYGNLHNDTSGHFKEVAAELAKKLKSAGELDLSILGPLHYAINAAFLLNPSGDPELDDLTPIEQVATRQPTRLLINIGNNEGLFRIGITGNFNRRHLDSLRKIPQLAEKLAEDLKQHCGGLDHIYFNLLIRPRVLANLAPRTDNELWNPPGCKNYFKKYVGRLLGGMNSMSSRQMKTFDDEVEKINQQTEKVMKKVMGNKPHIHFIDLFNIVADHDRKHGCEKSKDRIFVDYKGRRFRLSNFPFSANVAGFRHGGLFGLDNMHPCVPGYATLANAIGKEIARAEAANFTPIDWQFAFDNDTLLQNPPRNLDILMLLVSFVASLGFFKRGSSL